MKGFDLIASKYTGSILTLGRPPLEFTLRADVATGVQGAQRGATVILFGNRKTLIQFVNQFI